LTPTGLLMEGHYTQIPPTPTRQTSMSEMGILRQLSSKVGHFSVTEKLSTPNFAFADGAIYADLVQLLVGCANEFPLWRLSGQHVKNICIFRNMFGF